MAKGIDKDLYKTARAGGVRKKVARTVAEAATKAKDTGGKAPAALRSTAKELRSLADTLEDRATGGPAKREAAAKKAARTRKQKANERSAAAQKAARTRARKSSSSRSGGAGARAKSAPSRSVSTPSKGATLRSTAPGTRAKSAATPRRTPGPPS